MAANHQPLSGKVALVTGGTRGIGAGIVKKLAAHGASVALVFFADSSWGFAENMERDIHESGGRAIAIQADLRKDTSANEIVQMTVQAFGHIDIIVNNAAKPGGPSLDTLTPAAFEESFGINTLAPLLLVQAALPHLRRPGRIINVSSAISKRGAAGGALLYAGSKAALEAMSRCLAHELGKDGTTVNCVLPGPVDTDMMRLAPREMIEASMRATPLESRMGTVDDIADIVAFLASSESRWITGQCISATGGMVML